MTGVTYRNIANAVEVAEQHGHTLVPDPIQHPWSRLGRVTCSVCGDAVLVRGDGTGYGSATERDCREEEL